jgi:hypothetical protein
MGHNRSEDTCLHQTDAQDLQPCRTWRAGSFGRRSSETNRDLIATRSEDEQAQANKHIHMHKNITPYKIKCYKSEQYKIESASTVTREYETRRSELRSISYRVYAKGIWTRAFNSVLSNINYNYYLIKTRDSKGDEFTTNETPRQRANDARTRAT